MKLIKENDKAIIWQHETIFDGKGLSSYEIWTKLYFSVGTKIRSGEMMEPKDEDFGVWAWSAYSRNRAELIFDEITEGKRTITPMIEASN